MISRLSPRKGCIGLSSFWWVIVLGNLHHPLNWLDGKWKPDWHHFLKLLVLFSPHQLQVILIICPDCLTPLLLFWFYKTQWKCALFLPKSTSDKPWLWFCLLYLLHFVYFLMLLGVRKEGFENYLINEPEFNGREMGQWLISGHYIVGETSTVIGTEVYSDNRW